MVLRTKELTELAAVDAGSEDRRNGPRPMNGSEKQVGSATDPEQLVEHRGAKVEPEVGEPNCCNAGVSGGSAAPR